MGPPRKAGRRGSTLLVPKGGLSGGTSVHDPRPSPQGLRWDHSRPGAVVCPSGSVDLSGVRTPHTVGLQTPRGMSVTTVTTLAGTPFSSTQGQEPLLEYRHKKNPSWHRPLSLCLRESGKYWGGSPECHSWVGFVLVRVLFYGCSFVPHSCRVAVGKVYPEVLWVLSKHTEVTELHRSYPVRYLYPSAKHQTGPRRRPPLTLRYRVPTSERNSHLLSRGLNLISLRTC